MVSQLWSSPSTIWVVLNHSTLHACCCVGRIMVDRIVVTECIAYKVTKGLWAVIEKVYKHRSLEDSISKSSPEDFVIRAGNKRRYFVASVYITSKQKGTGGKVLCPGLQSQSSHEDCLTACLSAS